MDESEKKKKVRQQPKQIFSELVACNNHRLIVLMSFGIITSIVIDCPEACIWMPLDESQVPMYLVGSPLDILPIDPILFPTFLNEKESMEFTKTLKKLLASKLKQIHTRSCKIDNRWALNCSRETDFHLIVRACVDVVSLLDTADLTKPRAIFDLYSKVFGLTKGNNEFFDGEIVIRVKAMLQWAITNEREGSFRALLVSKILQIYVRHFRSLNFDSRNFVQIIVDFLNREAPSPGKASFRKEYSNLILLLIELQRASLFSHDEYIMLLIKYDELKDGEPIIPKLQKLLEPLKEVEAANLSDENIGRTSNENQQLIRNFLTPATTIIQGNLADHEFCRLKDDIEDEIVFMEKPEEMGIHERLIIQLPIEQIEANRGAVNQRAIYLYGITNEREEVSKNLRNFSTNIINKWLEFCYIFHRKRKTVKTRKNMVGLDECFKDFKKLTYYDRLCVTGYCMDGYLQILKDFTSKSTSSFSLPIIEIFDMLLSMAEAAQCIGWTITFFLECFPLILSCEKILDSVRTDLPPGTFSSQQCFAIVGFLAEHYKYFLLSKEAIKICNALFRVIEPAIRAEDYPTTGWSKAVAAFLIQARFDLRIRGKGFFAFRARDCQKLLPTHGTPIEYIQDFDDELFVSEDDLLNYQKRIYTFHDFKVFVQRLNSVEAEHSFVVNAFAMAKEFANDFSKLTELANFCGNISAVKSLESHWLNVIEALCTPHGSKRIRIPGFDKIDNSMDFFQHYTYSTFITLLATRFCFSVHSLFVRFNNDFFKAPHLYEGHKPHLLLTMQIIANISTATDEPFYISKSLFHLSNIPFRVPWRTSDLRINRILQIRELDAVILPLLLNIFSYVDGIKKKDTLRDIYSFAWNTVLTITDQEWIISRMFQICAVERDMEDFIKAVPNQNTGKLLLAIALRRKTDRKYKTEVMELRPALKTSIQKSFTVLTIWNLRATFCDLKVMIREAIPSRNGNGNKNAQYQALATNLIVEIGKSCRDFFLTDDVEKIRHLKCPTIESFTFLDLNCYWLLAELVEIITIPETLPKTIKGAFLDEVGNIFSTAPLDSLSENEREKKLKICANLLETQPFLNLLGTCQQGEEKSRDNMIKMMLDYGADIKLSENPIKLFEKRFNDDRAGILLRMNLVGTIIDFVNTPTDKLGEYAGCILQAMINGVISPERDGEYFTTCYDLLLTLVLALFTGPGQPQLDKEGNVKKPRYNDYTKFVNKITDKTMSGSLRCLEILFPIAAPTSEQPTFNDTFPVNSPMKNNGGKYPNIGPPGFARNIKHIKLDKHCDPAQKRIQRFLYHSHQNDFFHPGTIGNPLPKGMLEQFVVGPPAYTEPGPDFNPPGHHHPQMQHQHSLMNLRQQQQQQQHHANFSGGQHPHQQQQLHHPQQQPPHFYPPHHDRPIMQQQQHQQNPGLSMPPRPQPPGHHPQNNNMQMPPGPGQMGGGMHHPPNFNQMSQQQQQQQPSSSQNQHQ
uniref:Mediator complex subunit Med12 LCEWAV-domain domain-containing protein n=1 Tax=Panagrolaimus sp. PS1159 TaxID=55785 RepID=A0AC35EWM1_9BILA